MIYKLLNPVSCYNRQWKTTAYKEVQYMDEQPDLNVREVAAVLRVHPETVRVWLREGIFPNAYQLPRRSGWRIPRADVDAITKKSRRLTEQADGS